MGDFKRKRITVAELHTEMRAQGVSAREHLAFVCVMCRTVQSVASLMKADPELTAEEAESFIGFSCEGRLTNAGPPAPRNDESIGTILRRRTRGCNWTLGGLFQLHELEVVMEDGVVLPTFELATPEQAQQLEKEMTI